MKKPASEVISRLRARDVMAWRRNLSPWGELPNSLSIPSHIVIEPHTRMAVYAELYSVGSFSYSLSPMPGFVSIGRYCSIANGVSILGPKHPIDRVSTSPFTYERGFVDRYASLSKSIDFKIKPTSGYDRRPVKIGHDVWIGEHASLSQGIAIGNGAIVAAHSNVTKDIEPYTIVGGNPAKVIRRRFHSDSLIADLLDSQWWSYCFLDFHELPFDDPVRFLDGLNELKENKKVVAFQPLPVTAGDI